MKNAYKRWASGLLAGIALLLALCAAVVYKVDPFCYYRMPTDWKPVFFDERSQAVAFIKHAPADTVLLGTSMGANYRAGMIGETLGGTAARVTLPDGYLSEFDAAMDTVFRYQTPKRVIFSLDANILHRDESGISNTMPLYLYNDKTLDDVKYLLNKDALYYSAFVLMSNRWGGVVSQEEAFTWDEGIWWNHMTALDNYQRPEVVETPLAADAWFPETDANLAVVERWVTEHPETEFHIFFPPYSILFWDKTARLGQTDATFAMLERACKRLLQHDNVQVYGFLMDAEIVEDLDNYCDYVHHSGEVCEWVLSDIAAGENCLTEENLHETLANWQDFVVNYNYDQFWDASYWYAWNWNAQQQTENEVTG